MRIIKKYSNRRLYDTGESQYITLDELAKLIREGEDVKIVDAKSDENLTQPTLAQIVVESRGAARLLPEHLLVQMIRMGDDALAEFMSNYVAWALEVYFQVKKGVSRIPGMSEKNPVARMFAPWMRAYQEAWQGWGPEEDDVPVPPRPEDLPDPHEPPSQDDVASLRREIDELREILQDMRTS